MSGLFGLMFGIGTATTPANTAQSRSAGDQPYPTTEHGITFGGQTSGSSDNGSWTPGQSAYTSGVWTVYAPDGVQSVRLDLRDGPGLYRMRPLHADGSFASNAFAVHDGAIDGEALLDHAYYNGGGGDATKWLDAADTPHAYSEAPDFATLPYVEATFTEAFVTITNGVSGSFNSRLLGMYFEKVDDTPTLSFTTQPSDTMSGATMDTVVVTSSDNTDTSTVSLAISASTLGGTFSAAMVAGVGTFSALVPSGAGTNRRLTASATGYASVDSDDFDITSGEDDTPALLLLSASA